MRPACQGLNAHHGAGEQIDLRLVGDADLLVDDRTLELVGESQASRTGRVVFGSEERDALGCGLRGLQSHVRVLQEHFAGLAVIRVQDDADVRAQLRGERPQGDRASDDVAEVRADLPGPAPASTGRRDQEGEFVAAEMSRDHVGQAGEAAAHLDQRAVARRHDQACR